jgi:hypothetical protein
LPSFLPIEASGQISDRSWHGGIGGAAQATQKGSTVEEQEEPREYVIFPEEAIKYLPEEWQQHLYALKEEGQGVLEIADDNLRILNRLALRFRPWLAFVTSSIGSPPPSSNQ